MNNIEIKKKFAQRMGYVAKMTNFNLDEYTLKLYWEALKPYGSVRILAALDEFIKNLSQRTFPSVRQIQAIFEPILDEKDQAREIAATIWGCISKYGHVDPSGARKEIGETGWKAVELNGGWAQICESVTNKDKSHFIAQTRDLLSVYTKRESYKRSQEQVDTRVQQLTASMASCPGEIGGYIE